MGKIQKKKNHKPLTAKRKGSGFQRPMKKNALKGEQKKNTTLMNLLELNSFISNSLEKYDVLRRILQQVIKISNCEACSILLVDKQIHRLKFAVFSNTEDEKKLGNLTLSMGEGLAGNVWENGLPCISNDAQNDPRFSGHADLLTARITKSLMAAPLIVDGMVIGVIETVNKRKGMFTSFDLQVLQYISTQSAIAIKNADHYFMATRDGMTKLYTHKYFMEKLNEEWAKSFQFCRPLSLIIFDIDNFKKFNDRLGHQTGDLVLMKIARIIEKECCNKGYACRYGGEEFSVILPDSTRTDALVKAEKIRKDVSELEFKHGRRTLNTTVSGGVATIPELKPVDLHKMVEMADTALYNSKEKGKNRITFYQA